MRRNFGSLLTDEQRRSIVRNGLPRTYAPGEAIMFQGEPGTTIHLLVSGMVKVVAVRRDGTEVPLAFRGPGELLGESSLWSTQERSATVVAGVRSRTLMFPRERFRRHMKEAGLEAAVWQTILTRQRESDEVRAEHSALSGRRRLAAALLRLADALGEPIKPEITDVGSCQEEGALLSLALSQQEIADHIGLSRTSVALEYAYLKERGIIRTGRNYVAVRDLPALQALAHGSE